MKRIGKIFFIVLMMNGFVSAEAALAPSAVNVRDLQTMVRFIEQHQKVASTLERIDFDELTVVFDRGCRAYFERKKTGFFTSKPGPQADIVFKSSSCTLTDDPEG